MRSHDRLTSFIIEEVGPEKTSFQSMQQALLKLKGPSVTHVDHQHVPPLIKRKVQRRSVGSSPGKAERAPATCCDDVHADVVIIGGGEGTMQEKFEVG